MTQATIQLFNKQNSPRYFESENKNMEFVSKKPCKRLEAKLNGIKRLSYSNRNDEASYQQKLQRFCLIRNNVRNPPKNISESSVFSIRRNGTSSVDSKLKKIFQMNPNQNFNGITSTARSQPKKKPLTFPMNAESNTSTDDSIFNPTLLQNLINTVIATKQQEQKQKDNIHSALIKLLLGTQNNESVTTALLDTLLEILDQPQKSPSETSMPLYKTELCRNFEETGDCRYKDKCQFAHGSHELRNLQRHLKYKTELCRSYHNIGFCPYGIRCHFIHNVEEIRTPTKPATVSNSQHNIFSNMFTSMLSLEQTGLVGNLFKNDSQISLGCHTNTGSFSDTFMNSLSSKNSSTSLNSLLCDNKPK